MGNLSNSSDINQTFILEPLLVTGDTPTLSACTIFYTNNIQSCSGDTQILLGTNLIIFNGNFYSNNGLTANTISATTYLNLPIDIHITGGTYSNGSATFTNNTGGTFSVSGFSSSATFTGGTVAGPTNFTNGLTANTISATTYFNLPIDIRITGGTYSNGSTTFTNNTGGTFSVSGFSTGSSNTIWTTGSTGQYSIKAINDSNLDATGSYAIAEGYNTLASGDYSHAEGLFTVSSGVSSHVEGNQTKALGDFSHAEGNQSTANNNTTHVEGYQSTANGNVSHSEGYQTTSIGDNSHSEGYNTTAIGFTSHAEGGLTIANGGFSHAEGYTATALGDFSHTEGIYTTAIGQFSHAGGNTSIANGDGSFVHGQSSIASGTTTIVLGDNITGTTDNTLYVDRLNVKTISGDTSIMNIGIDINGFITTGTSASSFSGGTVIGPTNFTNGLTANTFSASTYFNLPIDIRVTGGTYSNGTGIAIFKNNTGGTFSVSGFSTGSTDIYTTGVTLSNSTVTFRRNDNNTYGINLSALTTGYLPLSGGTLTGRVTGTTFFVNDAVEFSGDSINISTHITNPTLSANTNWFVDDSGPYIGAWSATPVTFNAGDFVSYLGDIYQNQTGSNSTFNPSVDPFGDWLLSYNNYVGSFNPSSVYAIGVVVDYQGFIYTHLTNTNLIYNNIAYNGSGFTFGSNAATYATIYPTSLDVPEITSPTGTLTLFTSNVLVNAFSFNVGASSNIFMNATNYSYFGINGNYNNLVFFNNSAGDILSPNTDAYASLFATKNSRINSTAYNSPILGGSNGLMQAGIQNSVILGGNGVTATTNNTAYVDRLNIKTIGSGSTIINLGLDSSGNVVTGSTAGTEVFVTGGTYNNSTTNGTAIFTNNTGGTFSINGFSSSFTGGTVTGNTTFNAGLSASTITSTSLTASTISSTTITVTNIISNDIDFPTIAAFRFLTGN